MSNITVTTGPDGSLHLGPTVIPLPTTISENARKALSTPFPEIPQPPASDKEAWREVVRASDAAFAPMVEQWLKALPASVETRTIAGVTVHVATPHDNRHPERAHLRIHGGAWAMMGGKFSMGEAAMTAAQFGCVAWGLDYRMPPDHPFPAAVEDGLAVWRELIKQYDPKKIAMSGASAGGNLTAAITLKVRDAGLPMPRVVGLLTPATDLTCSGDTYHTNNGIDTVLRPVPTMMELYADGHDLTDPYLSPVFGDFSKGFPPTFLQSGTRDLLLSDTVRMHRALVRAGIPAELNVWEAMPHGGFAGTSGLATPEDAETGQALVAFVEKWLG